MGTCIPNANHRGCRLCQGCRLCTSILLPRSTCGVSWPLPTVSYRDTPATTGYPLCQHLTSHRRTGICDLDLPVRDTHPSTYSKASEKHSLHSLQVIAELCLCAGVCGTGAALQLAVLWLEATTADCASGNVNSVMLYNYSSVCGNCWSNQQLSVLQA